MSANGRDVEAVSRRSVIRSYRDIEAYQRAMALLAPLHQLLRRLPKEEQWELASQLRRASKSVAANIAEGYARRRSDNHFRTYLDTALGSANEVIVHLEIAVAVGYLSEADIAPLVEGYEIVGKQLFRLAENWRSVRAAELEVGYGLTRVPFSLLTSHFSLLKEEPQ